MWGVHTSILSLVGSVPVRVRADYLGRYRSVSGQSKCLLLLLGPKPTPPSLPKTLHASAGATPATTLSPAPHDQAALITTPFEGRTGANPSRQPGNLGFDPLSLSTPKNRYKYELAEVRPTLTRTMNPEPAIMRLKILQCYMCQLGEAHAALEVSVRARDSGLRAGPAAVCVCAARSQQAIACARRDAVTLP